jgi:hypothetical protein
VPDSIIGYIGRCWHHFFLFPSLFLLLFQGFFLLLEFHTKFQLLFFISPALLIHLFPLSFSFISTSHSMFFLGFCKKNNLRCDIRNRFICSWRLPLFSLCALGPACLWTSRTHFLSMVTISETIGPQHLAGRVDFPLHPYLP